SESHGQQIGEEEPPMATKKVVSLSGKKRKTPKPPPTSTDTDRFRERNASLCSHITAGDYDSPGEIYEAARLLLTQIQSLFSALGSLNGGDEETLSLCMLGEDLTAEAQHRVDRFRHEV